MRLDSFTPVYPITKNIFRILMRDKKIFYLNYCRIFYISCIKEGLNKGTAGMLTILEFITRGFSQKII